MLNIEFVLRIYVVTQPAAQYFMNVQVAHFSS